MCRRDIQFVFKNTPILIGRSCIDFTSLKVVNLFLFGVYGLSFILISFDFFFSCICKESITESPL